MGKNRCNLGGRLNSKFGLIWLIRIIFLWQLTVKSHRNSPLLDVNNDTQIVHMQSWKMTLFVSNNKFHMQNMNMKTNKSNHSVMSVLVYVLLYFIVALRLWNVVVLLFNLVLFCSDQASFPKDTLQYECENIHLFVFWLLLTCAPLGL